jgi:hypothetical protein
MRATPTGYDQKPEVGKPIIINAIASNGDANVLRKSKSSAADVLHGRRSTEQATNDWNEASHQPELHRSRTRTDVDRGFNRKYRPAADVNVNRTDDYLRRHSGTLPGRYDRNKINSRAHARDKDKSGYQTDDGFVYNDERTLSGKSGYLTDDGFYGEMQTDASHGWRRAPVEERPIHATSNEVSFAGNKQVAAKRLFREPADRVDTAAEVSAAASEDFADGWGFERLQRRRTSAVEDDETEIPVIIRNKPDVHQQIINSRRSQPARQDQPSPAVVRNDSGISKQKTDHRQTEVTKQFATPIVIRDEISIPQQTVNPSQKLPTEHSWVVPVVRCETENSHENFSSRQVAYPEQKSAAPAVVRSETRRNSALVKIDEGVSQQQTDSRQLMPAQQNAAAKTESGVSQPYADDRTARPTEPGNQTSATPTKVAENPVSKRTPLRRTSYDVGSSQRNASDEQLDLVAIRNSLRPVERRKSADNVLNADSSFFDDVIKLTMEEFDAESTDMLAELGRARNMLAVEQDNSQLQQLLSQLNAKASRHEDRVVTGSPAADRSGMAKENRDKAPDVSRPVTSSRMSEASTTNTLMSDNHKQRIASGASGRATDENNNKDDDSRRMMSPDQLERIESWRTEASWNDDSPHDSLDELDDDLKRQQSDHQSDITSIPSRRSSRARSNSSSSFDEYGPHRGDDDDGDDAKQSVQFEYFFGFDAPVTGKR